MSFVSSEEIVRIATEAGEAELPTKVGAKRYLQSVGRMEDAINQKRQELELMKINAAGISGIEYDRDRVQTSLEGGRMEKDVAWYIDLEREIQEDIRELIERRHKIIGEIQRLENRDYSALLYKRYVEYKRLEVISVEMNYTYDHARRMHGKALLEFERVYREEGKNDVGEKRDADRNAG